MLYVVVQVIDRTLRLYSSDRTIEFELIEIPDDRTLVRSIQRIVRTLVTMIPGDRLQIRRLLIHEGQKDRIVEPHRFGINLDGEWVTLNNLDFREPWESFN